MFRKSLLVLVGSAVVIGAWACVGDEPADAVNNAPDAATGTTSSSSSSSGSSGAASSSSGAASSSGASSGSTSSGAPPDAGADAGPTLPRNNWNDAGLGECVFMAGKTYPKCTTDETTDVITCGLNAPACCPGVNCVGAASDCQPNYDNVTQCFSHEQCGGTQHCCVGGALKNTTTPGCGAPFEITATKNLTVTAAPRCAVSAGCQDDQVEFCDTPDSQRGSCPSGKICRAAALELRSGDPQQLLKYQIVPVCVAADKVGAP